MKNNKLNSFPGLSLFVCFCLLRGSERLVERLGEKPWLYALAEILSFMLPTALALYSIRDQKSFLRRLMRYRYPQGAIAFSIKLGFAAAAASVLADILSMRFAVHSNIMLSVTAMDIPSGRLSLIWRVLLLVLLPAFVEELFLRGTLLLANEQSACTLGCMLAGGTAYAMLYGDVSSLAGPFLIGAAYAYLVYSFDGVLPAVLAHLSGGLYYFGASWIAQTYGAFDILKYFTVINVLMLLFFLYIALRSAEILLLDGSIPKFQTGGGLYDMLLLARNPGVAAFAIVFIVKAVLHWI